MGAYEEAVKGRYEDVKKGSKPLDRYWHRPSHRTSGRVDAITWKVGTIAGSLSGAALALWAVLS